MSPTLRAAALAGALFAAAAGGWLLHAVLGRPDPVMTIAARQAAGTPTPATRPVVAASPAPVPEPSATAVPAAVPEATVAQAPPPAVERAPAAPALKRDGARQTVADLPAVVRPAAGRTVAEPPAPVPEPRPPAVARADASFDCRRAQTEVNRMICADARLGALDAAMGDAYRAAVERGGAAAEYDIDREQASFLNARAGCETPGCIARITRQRLDDLYNY